MKDKNLFILLSFLLRIQQLLVNGIQFSCKKHQITHTTIELSAVFFLCKQILCISTFELLCKSSRSSLYNTVVESVRFALLRKSKICSSFETNKYCSYNYKLTKYQRAKKIVKINKFVISISQYSSVNFEKTK